MLPWLSPDDPRRVPWPTLRGQGARVRNLPSSILDEGVHFEIDVEVPGWTESVAVPSPARPGEVRAAVTKLLRELGLTRV